MKKITLTGVLCALMTAPAFATYGTEMHTTLDDAKNAIERIDNSWDAMRDLRETLNGSTNPMDDLVTWATETNTDSAYEGETDNIGVVHGIINDTAVIMQGYYTNAVLANDAIALNNDAIALNSAAISELDNRIEDIDSDLSAGIASVAALSSVAVSNVSRGEVSVGGGYGYHNGESAVAVGFAIGLTDEWSVNAGAGISSSDTTFRAGTNYKFKLF